MTNEPRPLPRALRQFSGLAGLTASRYRSPEALRRLQAVHLRRLAAAAVRDVPFHRERWRLAGLRPEDIRSLDDLPAIPIMTRSDLQGSSIADVVSSSVDPTRLRTFMTSGTTGAPLTARYRPEDETIINLTWIRAYMACGLRPRDRLATFQGDSRQAPPSMSHWYSRLGFWRRTSLSTWDEPAAWLERLAEYRPDAVMACAAAFRILADFILASGAKGVSSRLLFSSSILLDPVTRTRLGAALGGRVFDLYGSFESGCLAWECPACDGYHINSDTAIVEILKDGREAAPGETGEVVVTNLFSTAMPFIRYALGDLVIKSDREPKCGWPFPLIARLDGRREEIISFKDGRRFAPQPFHHIFSPESGVKRWQVVQDGPQSVSISIEAGPGFGDSSRTLIEASVRDLLGPSVEIRWDFEARLPYDPGSKQRAVINRSLERGDGA